MLVPLLIHKITKNYDQHYIFLHVNHDYHTKPSTNYFVHPFYANNTRPKNLLKKKAKENEKGNLKKKNKETPTVSNIFATSKFKIMGQKCKIIQCEQQREKPCQIIILQ